MNISTEVGRFTYSLIFNTLYTKHIYWSFPAVNNYKSSQIPSLLPRLLNEFPKCFCGTLETDTLHHIVLIWLNWESNDFLINPYFKKCLREIMRHIVMNEKHLSAYSLKFWLFVSLSNWFSCQQMQLLLAMLMNV